MKKPSMNWKKEELLNISTQLLDENLFLFKKNRKLYQDLKGHQATIRSLVYQLDELVDKIEDGRITVDYYSIQDEKPLKENIGGYQ